MRTECRETQQTNATWVAAVYRQSVAMLADQKWDSVKLDGCSQFHNTSLWANLMEETGHPIAIENCNNEHPPAVGPNPDWADHDGQCPYNWYRTSSDIQPSWLSIMSNFASTVRYTQDLTHPRSKPGCWAYPDMLQVGNMVRPSPIPSACTQSTRAQGSSGVVDNMPFAWRGHTKSLTTRDRPSPDLAVWLE